MKASITAATFIAALILAVHAQSPEPAPAFPGQTDAPAPSRPSAAFDTQVIADGLAGAWAMAFLHDGNFLVTQNAGTMRIVRRDGIVSAPLGGVPDVKVVAAQGLHDVVLDPQFAANRLLYFTYFAPPKGEAPATWPIEYFYERVWTKPLAERRTMQLGAERIARARLSDDNRRLENVEVLAEGAERRIVIARDGTLLITGADRFRFYDSDLDGVDHDFTDNPDVRRNFSGRVLRINRDGSIPKDNPWLGRATVLAETYAHGFKDPEGAALHPQTGELWMIDHGPQGGDEVNIVRPGKDYGWPDVSYGRQYDARQTDGRKNVPVGSGKTAMPGVEQPIYYWVPSIAPSGMAFYTGDLFPEWKGDLFVGAMAGQHLVRLVLKGERVVAEERLLAGRKQRIREIRQGPDGAIYIFMGAQLVRLSPKK
ncbi:MAG TPA: PQQ-dependent sugar dehydrogenase [Vicinamibacterales bacterium]|nr:PQQ-dependent sugar dehydrogenase [Vicinamibacterales bacterium]